MPRRLLMLFLLPILVTTSDAATGARNPGVVHGDRGIAIDRHVGRLAAFGIAGALYVEKDGEVLVEKGYGIADRSTGAVISPDSPFLIGSLSKQMTAAAVLALEADGKLATTDSIGRFYPEAPGATRRLTLHQLLSHTSGLPYLEGDFFATLPRDSVMRDVLALPLDFEPGARYAYSNPGYTLLAGVIEKASGRSFEDFLRTRLFERAGLTRTRCLDPGLRDTMDLLEVHSYSGGDDEGTMLPLRAMSRSVGSGSVVSTAADLGRWARALTDDRVLPAAQRAKLFTPYADVNPGTRYAYGWNVVKTSRGTTMFQHAGDLGGWNADMRIDRDANLVMVFLSNTRIDGRGARDGLMTPVTLLATGAAVPELPALVTAKPAETKAIAGRFLAEDGGSLRAVALDGAIELSAEDASGLVLLAADSAAVANAAAVAPGADSVVTALAASDFTPFLLHLHPSLPADGIPAVLDTALARARVRLGDVTRVETIGSLAMGPRAGVTFARIHRARGVSVLRLGWVGGRILSFDFEAPAILPTRFLPATDGTWVHIDPFTARVTRIRIERDAGGRVLAVGMIGTAGERTARRVG